MCIRDRLSTEPNYRPRDFIFNYLLKPDFIVGCDPKVKSINLFLYHPTTYNHPVSQAFCNLMEKGHLAYSTPVSYTPLFTKDSLSQALAYLRPKASTNSSAVAPEGAVASPEGPAQSAGSSQGLGRAKIPALTWGLWQRVAVLMMGSLCLVLILWEHQRLVE